MAKFYKFDSGLMLLYETNNINKSTSIEISFDCGARCDGKISGLSHFCEHMFFSGTNKLSKQEVTKRYFDFIKTNAFTTNSNITFTGSIVTRRLAEYLSCVQDMICNSTFKASAIEEEKKIVIQEIVQASDNHIRIADELYSYDIYEQEHYKNGVLGSKESVNQIKSKDVKNYVNKYFVKNNCIIYICSPLSFSKVKDIVKKHFDDKMPSNNLEKLPYCENKLIDAERVTINHKKIDKNFLSITFKFKRNGPDLKYRVMLGAICNIIDDISDGLTKELRLDNSLIYGMGSDYMVNKVNSYLELRTEISKENIKPCLDIIIDYINRLRANGFTKEQFLKELEKDEYYWQTKVITPSNILNILTRYRFYGKFINDESVHKQVQSLKLAELNETMKDLFNDAKIQLFVYGNANKRDVYTIDQIQKKIKM